MSRSMKKDNLRVSELELFSVLSEVELEICLSVRPVDNLGSRFSLEVNMTGDEISMEVSQENVFDL